MRNRILSLITALALCLGLLPATALAADAVSYLACDENGQNWTEKSCTNYTVVTAEENTWGAEDEERWYVVKEDTVIDKYVTVKGDVHLILTDNAKLTVNFCIIANAGNSFTVYAHSKDETVMGSLSAINKNSADCAGIGGSGNNACGTITINGGNVTANGGRGAGIGGYRGNGDTITINGGTVTASGGGAGIGGSYSDAGGTITINGGTVTAESTGSGAGIGGGYDGAGGTITINGGTVTATGNYGAGIGGGNGGAGGTITINGGTVIAKSKHVGAGIGGGEKGDGGTITIGGGTVTAESTYGAGIGGGTFVGFSGNTVVGGSGGTIHITGNANVTATGGVKSAGIGGGKGGNSNGGNGGNITIDGKSTVTVTGGTDAPDIGGGRHENNNTIAATDSIVIEESATVKRPDGSDAVLGGSHNRLSEDWKWDSDAHWHPCSVSGCTNQDHQTAPEKHNWTGPEWSWYPDYPGYPYRYAEAIFSCEVCEWKKYVTDRDLDESIIDPTCTEDGKIIYTATVEFDGETYTDRKEETDKNNPPTDHAWASEWQSADENYHWHECANTNCPVAENSAKDGYGSHVYANNMDATCDTCGHVRTIAPITYPVTIIGGTADKSSAARGEAVTITASVPSGKEFAGWAITPSVTFTSGGANTPTATFTMPGQAISVTANFRDKSSGNGGGSSGGGSSTPTYPPTVEKPSEGGTVTVSPSRPSNGDKVTVRPKPDSGYEVEKVNVTDKNGKPVTVTKNPDGTYSFTQPNGIVKVEVIYKLTETPWSNPFRDVAEIAWYYEAVQYVSENGLMNGYSDGCFGPNDNLSRAQLAQILFNREGRPVVNYLLQYGDVADGTWYTEAVRWATSQGIVGGYGNGKFGPNDPITREQLAVMLWRYAGSPAATNKELHFNDEAEISGYALEAIRWAVENGIISGYDDGRLGPRGQATRAQVAQMLKNFLENQ